MLTDPAVYFLVYDALTHTGGASAARFNRFYCNYFTNQTLLTGYAPEFLKATALDLIRLTTPVDSPGSRSLVEPPLKVRDEFAVLSLKRDALLTISCDLLNRCMCANKGKLLSVVVHELRTCSLSFIINS